MCRYVVDLVRFRRIAAGDRLRGQYQALSQDPNSLSNLDQVWKFVVKAARLLACIKLNLIAPVIFCRICPTT